MKKERKPPQKHKFTKLPEFDAAMRGLAAVPKERVEAAEKKSRTPRPKR